MKKSIVLLSISLLITAFLFGCSKSQKEISKPAAAEEAEEAEVAKNGFAQVTASAPIEKEASEYSSTEDIKKDFERFQEAIASQDKEKCAAIQGQALRERCQENFNSP